ncbi:MAG: pilus assembly protein TadG-related protein [Pseudooceanicola sp.]
MFQFTSVKLRFFAKTEDGSITILALFVLAGAILVSSFAIDFSYLQTSRTQLQVAADSAAHAALYYRETHTADEAKKKAIEIASHDMPSKTYGAVLTETNIEFGTWDDEAGTFTPDSASVQAVRVQPQRSAEAGNAVKTFLFRLLGVEYWDIATEAVFVTFQPPCMREGFVAHGEVDFQSNNSFSNGFCVHSNSYVSLNSNNVFEQGTVVSMPDLGLLDVPKSGFDKNEGLQVALRRGYFRMRILNQLDDIESDLYAGSGAWVPDFVTNSIRVPVADSKLTADLFIENRIHELECSKKQTTIEADTVLRNVVILASCELKFGQGVVLENVVIFNSDTSTKSFNAPSGFQIGKDDSCSPGGGAQLITRGGVNVAAGLQMYGGQIIAAGDVEFAANADGVEGATILAGGVISSTSNMNMALCGTGMEGNFAVPYFRLAL